MARFTIDKYGVLEMQRAEYLKTGMIVSQSPLSAEFTEKDFTGWRPALKHFCQVAGEYPRVGILNVGDTFTTNTFSYEFGEENQWEELKAAFAEGPLYVVPTIGEGAPTVTAEKPAEGPYAQVVKLYTVPAGTPGIKYVMQRV